MSRRRGQSAPAVSLFPFLAVLLCAMGSLILLLLIITQQARLSPVSQIRHKPEVNENLVEVVADVAQLPALISSTSEDFAEPEMFTPVPEQKLEQASEPEPEQPRPNYPVARRYQPELDGQSLEYVTGKLREWQGIREQQQHELARQQAGIRQLEQARTLQKSELEKLQSQLTMLEQTDQLLHQSGEAQRQSVQELSQKIQALRTELLGKSAEITAVEQDLKNRQNKLEVVTFDGPTGVKRQPIIVECRAGEVIFHPEQVAVSLMDLEDFSPGSTPLLAGIRALSEYRSQKSGQHLPPYVLMVGRPTGIEEFYACGNSLSHGNIPFGYELISQEHQLYVGKHDPEARRVLLEALAQSRRQAKVPQSRFARMGALAEEEKILPRTMREPGPFNKKTPTGSSGQEPGNSQRTPSAPEGAGQEQNAFGADPALPRPTGPASRGESLERFDLARPTAPLKRPMSTQEREQRQLASQQNLAQSLSEIQQEMQPKSSGQASTALIPPAPEPSFISSEGMLSEPLMSTRVESVRDAAPPQFPVLPQQTGSGNNVPGTPGEQQWRQGDWSAASSGAIPATNSPFTASPNSASSADSAQGQPGQQGVRQQGAETSTTEKTAENDSGFRPIESVNRSPSARQNVPQPSGSRKSNSIRVEQKVVIQVTPQGLQVGRQEFVPWSGDVRSERFSRLLWRLTEQELLRHPEPPEGISWIPAFHLQVAPGGNQLAFRIEHLAKQESFKTTTEFMWGPAANSHENIFR